MADYTQTAGSAPTLAPVPSTFCPEAASDFPVGTPVYVTAGGLAQIAFAFDGSALLKNVAGLARTAGRTGERCLVQHGDVLQLTTTEWDAIAVGASGGLLPGRLYYLWSTAGKIALAPPVTEDGLSTRVGLAISATEMLLQLSFPLAGLQDD